MNNKKIWNILIQVVDEPNEIGEFYNEEDMNSHIKDDITAILNPNGLEVVRYKAEEKEENGGKIK